MKNTAISEGPLGGYRVLEFCHFISGPTAAVLLADQGAEVIKVEPLGGDNLRSVGPAHNGMTAPFIAWNRNKRSIALDLSKTEGVEIAHRLTETADVLIHNYRPGVVDRLGIGPQEMRKIKPDLIYVSITGFGEDGPYAKRPAFDCVIQGLSGFASSQMRDAKSEPRMIRNAVMDKITGIAAAQATTAALCRRERTGQGAHVEISMLDLAVSFGWGDVLCSEIFVESPGAEKTMDRGDWLQPTMDGYVICQPVSLAQVERISEISGHPEWATDPRFMTPAARSNNMALWSETLKTAFRHLTTSETLSRLTEAGIPCAPVHGAAEVLEDPQIVHNRIVLRRHHSIVGEINECRAAACFDGALELGREAPQLGQDSTEIMRSLGYSEDAIQDFKNRRLVG